MTTVIIWLLIAVDITALAIGISIRRTVTRIVNQTASDIETAVKAGIADAVGKIAGVAATIMGQLGQAPRGDGLLAHVPELVDELVGQATSPNCAIPE